MPNAFVLSIERIKSVYLLIRSVILFNTCVVLANPLDLEKLCALFIDVSLAVDNIRFLFMPIPSIKLNCSIYCVEFVFFNGIGRGGVPTLRNCSPQKQSIMQMH